MTQYGSHGGVQRLHKYVIHKYVNDRLYTNRPLAGICSCWFLSIGIGLLYPAAVQWPDQVQRTDQTYIRYMQTCSGMYVLLVRSFHLNPQFLAVYACGGDGGDPFAVDLFTTVVTWSHISLPFPFMLALIDSGLSTLNCPGCETELQPSAVSSSASQMCFCVAQPPHAVFRCIWACYTYVCSRVPMFLSCLFLCMYSFMYDYVRCMCTKKQISWELLKHVKELHILTISCIFCVVLPRQGCSERTANSTSDMSALGMLVARGLPELPPRSPQQWVHRCSRVMSSVWTGCTSEQAAGPWESLPQQTCCLPALPNGSPCNPNGGDYASQGIGHVDACCLSCAVLDCSSAWSNGGVCRTCMVCNSHIMVWEFPLACP